MIDIDTLTFVEIKNVISELESEIERRDHNLEKLRKLLDPNTYYRQDITKMNMLTIDHPVKISTEEILLFDIDRDKINKYLEVGYFIIKNNETP